MVRPRVIASSMVPLACIALQLTVEHMLDNDGCAGFKTAGISQW
jgi:hypothetical protein